MRDAVLHQKDVAPHAVGIPSRRSKYSYSPEAGLLKASGSDIFVHGYVRDESLDRDMMGILLDERAKGVRSDSPSSKPQVYSDVKATCGCLPRPKRLVDHMQRSYDLVVDENLEIASRVGSPRSRCFRTRTVCGCGVSRNVLHVNRFRRPQDDKRASQLHGLHQPLLILLRGAQRQPVIRHNPCGVGAQLESNM